MPEPSLAAFLNGEVEAGSFHHADHLRVAYELLGRCDFPRAAAQYSAALRAIVTKAGHPGAYHETMTLAFLAVIAERRAHAEAGSFADFVARNPDLLDKCVLERWYSPDRLGSDLARRTFVLPEPAR